MKLKPRLSPVAAPIMETFNSEPGLKICVRVETTIQIRRSNVKFIGQMSTNIVKI